MDEVFSIEMKYNKLHLQQNSYIHNSTILSADVSIGHFCIFEPDCEIGYHTEIKDYVRLGSNTKIGNNCFIDSYVKMSGNCRIGNGVKIRYDSIIARNCIIGNDVFIAPKVMFIFNREKQTLIGHGVKIMTGAIIDGGIYICENCVIGANSFVNRDCTKPGNYFGTPCRRQLG